MDDRVRAVIALMNTNLDRQLRVAEMAAAVRLSPSQLRQVFKAQTEAPLGRYLRDLRMFRAKELFETTFLSVKEVAARVGITGISHFVRDFEKAYGMTPTRYVARHRKADQPSNPLTNRHFG